jgi:hypothetical protein
MIEGYTKDAHEILISDLQELVLEYYHLNNIEELRSANKSHFTNNRECIIDIYYPKEVTTNTINN